MVCASCILRQNSQKGASATPVMTTVTARKATALIIPGRMVDFVVRRAPIRANVLMVSSATTKGNVLRNTIIALRLAATSRLVPIAGGTRPARVEFASPMGALCFVARFARKAVLMGRIVSQGRSARRWSATPFGTAAAHRIGPAFGKRSLQVSPVETPWEVFASL